MRRQVLVLIFSHSAQFLTVEGLQETGGDRRLPAQESRTDSTEYRADYRRSQQEINSSNSAAHKPEVEIYIRRLCFPSQQPASPSLVNSLHGILRYLLHMLPLALRFRVFKESAAGLFSSFLHLMDFISRHFLTTTQWSSSASISQFSSVNCQVTVPRKLAIIFSLISRNIFKE